MTVISRDPSSVSAQDGHFLAGFIEAEGCFQITANNGGTSWCCSFGLAVRDDDAELLVELQSLTGLGNLRRKPGYGTSKPQVTWQIDSWREAWRLAQLLQEFPLRGRKRQEAEVWTRALRELDGTPCPKRLPQLAADLRSLKRYVNPPPLARRAPALDDDLLAYLGGFFTGEGHLSLSRGRCRTAVHLRDDDRPLLETSLLLRALAGCIRFRAPVVRARRSSGSSIAMTSSARSYTCWTAPHFVGARPESSLPGDSPRSS
jgi:hypothetical protein